MFHKWRYILDHLGRASSKTDLPTLTSWFKYRCELRNQSLLGHHHCYHHQIMISMFERQHNPYHCHHLGSTTTIIPGPTRSMPSPTPCLVPSSLPPGHEQLTAQRLLCHDLRYYHQHHRCTRCGHHPFSVQTEEETNNSVLISGCCQRSEG